MSIAEAIRQICEKKSLSREQAREVFEALMSGQATPVQIGALLIGLRMKGETVDEITGAAEAMREAAISVRLPKGVVVDTCGTGGDQQGSINVSTMTAFVVAGAGFTVAKHGNRSISSRSGSADVLEAAGISAQADRSQVEKCLEEAGIAFLFAPLFHPAMKHAMPIRKELGVRTIFNLLGPLTNPARPHVQIMGVYDAKLVKPLAQVLAALGCKEGLVVHGQGHDEIVLQGPTQIAEIIHGRVSTKTLTPENFGLKRRSKPDIQGGDPARNAETLRAVLLGKKGDARDVVCMNAAAVIRAALRFSSKTVSLREAMKLAQESIDSGNADKKFLMLKAVLS